MKKAVLMLLSILVLAAGTVNAGLISEVYAKRMEAIATAPVVYQTEVFALPIYVARHMVAVDRCVDGLRVWHTDKNMKDSRIIRLRDAVKKYYPAADVFTTSAANCPDDAEVNRIIFFYEGKSGDPDFFNAVERALNELAIGKVQSKAQSQSKR